MLNNQIMKVQSQPPNNQIQQQQNNVIVTSMGSDLISNSSISLSSPMTTKTVSLNSSGQTIKVLPGGSSGTVTTISGNTGGLVNAVGQQQHQQVVLGTAIKVFKNEITNFCFN